MTFQLLVAAMHKNPIELAKEMNLQSDAIIVSQGEEYAYSEECYKGHTIRYFAMTERGVGLSRNTSLLRADADIALFADEDIVYEDGYAGKIAAEVEKNPQADMILFNVTVDESRRTYHITERKRVRWYNCGRYGAVSFAVRTESLLSSGVMFLLLFGGGARYSNGEDSLFLKEFMRKGYRVYTAPVTIGREEAGDSTWFKGYDKKFFYDRGVLYHYLYGKLAVLFSLRFLVAHKSKMCATVSVKQAWQWMREGVAEGRKCAGGR
jgi:glycosyltransferase involved in cell wall biosynthesis